MDDTGGLKVKNKMKGKFVEEEASDDEVWDSDDDDDTIARIQRAHYAQTAAMNHRRRAAPRARPMSIKRKMEAVKNFHNFTKKLKKDTGVTIRSLVGNNILELSDFSSEDSSSESDGLSEKEFEVNPNAVQELNEENESYIDPVTGDIVETKQKNEAYLNPVSSDFDDSNHISTYDKSPTEPEESKCISSKDDNTSEEPKTLSISDIINEGDLDLTRNVEISEVDQGDLCTEKTAEELLCMKDEDSGQDYDITEKLKEMGEISVKPVGKSESDSGEGLKDNDKKTDDEEVMLRLFNIK